MRKTADEETRILTVVGVGVVLAIAVAIALVVANPFASRPKDLISIQIDSPYVGQGVDTGTALIMHGVEVGEVKKVSSLPGGAVRLNADLRTSAAAGLTDTFTIDFRPANYFGVTGINISKGHGGQPLRDGMQIEAATRGNYTLQTLLSRLGDITDGVVTPQLVSVIDRSTRYVDGLNPLVETMLTVTKAVDNVQTVSTAQLMRNAAGLSVAFPGFVDAATDAGDRFDRAGLVEFDHTGGEVTEQFWKDHYLPTVELAAFGLFAAVGRLESSHVDDLLPAVEIVKILSDTVPGLVRPPDISETLVELRRRFENMYGGTPEQRAMQVHIVLDSLPGVAAPLGVMGATP
ncbi:Mammalian cell entry related domain protein [Mycobacterium barrassiae]|uniref:Mammalian cell entry related domain protein n=1 Tax=Mycobacterium barrassiae TaxID=319709 RepID=UPI002265D671|nr:Mammalian cell entry related domain protein [Mycobacterium barrassiae]MCV7298615.1 Mammalian cell entry related domain protein [Mycobacterium barrassiae]